MTEENYKEITAAVKESGIPLQMQKELQRLLDKEFIENEEIRKVAPVQQKVRKNDSKRILATIKSNGYPN